MGIGKSLKKVIEKNAKKKEIDTLAVLATVTNYPCLISTKIAEKLEATTGTVRWHLKKLVNEHLVVAERIGGKVLFYTEGFLDNDDVEKIAFLQNPEIHEIISRIARHGGISKRELLAFIPEDKHSKFYTYENFLTKSVHLGLIRILKDMKINYYYLSNSFIQLIKNYSLREQKSAKAFINKMNQVLPRFSQNARCEIIVKDFEYCVLISHKNNTLAGEYILHTNPLWQYRQFIPLEQF
ncbi:MAG: hypothetical protein ACPL1Y_04290 [Thermoplasmata archaeon]